MFHVKHGVPGLAQPAAVRPRPMDMHPVIWWIIVGFIAGVLAKALMPGKKHEPQGCIMTILLGIAGSVVTGFLMRLLLGERGGGGFVGTIVGATLGAMLLILIFRKVWK